MAGVQITCIVFGGIDSIVCVYYFTLDSTAKADILKLWDDGVNGRWKLVAVRKCPYVDLNAKVFDWFCSARARNIPLTGRLQAKASELSREMGYDGVTL